MTTPELSIDFGLGGKRAIVAGAGEGMGRATAWRLASAGARVMCVDLMQERADAIRDDIRAAGGSAESLSGDVCERDVVDRIVETTIEQFGGVDVSVDIVGTQTRGGIVDISDETWDRNMRINLRHSFLIAQRVASQMLEQGTGGSLVFITSISGIRGHAHNIGYATAKAALISMIKSAAIELAASGIRVNGIAPGTIDTPRIRAITTPEFRAHRAASVPMQRQGAPEDIANAALFLASDLSAYITGHNLVVDGGAMVDFPFGPFASSAAPE